MATARAAAAMAILRRERGANFGYRTCVWPRVVQNQPVRISESTIRCSCRNPCYGNAVSGPRSIAVDDDLVDEAPDKGLVLGRRP